MRNEIINDWYPETKALLDALVKAGCVLVSGDNGEEKFKFDGNSGPAALDKFIADLTACDESRLYLTIAGKKRWVYLVYGNRPGELASDYIVDPVLDKVTQAHYDEWSLKGQPKMLSIAAYTKGVTYDRVENCIRYEGKRYANTEAGANLLVNDLELRGKFEKGVSK